MFSARLRHRADPMTSAPRAIACSAMWLPTNPVIPVMGDRMACILHEPDVTTRLDHRALLPRLEGGMRPQHNVLGFEHARRRLMVAATPARPQRKPCSTGRAARHGRGRVGRNA